MAEISVPTIRIDGTRVRRIREEKKLTQLYVAKVVGVTTDTISRWENNRYPSIKRENAQSLCEALEVELPEILECPEEPVQEVQELAARTKPAVHKLVYILPMLLVACAFVYFQMQAAPMFTMSTERVLPNYAAPGGVVPVRVRLDPGPEVQGFILREHFPPGWKLIEAVPPASSLNNEEGTVRWIIKPGEVQKVISYLVQVPRDAQVGKKIEFSGEIVATPKERSSAIDVQGGTSMEVGPFLWADGNGDRVVDDVEMLAASGAIEEMKGIHLEWGQLEEIWSSEGYVWELDKGRFLPRRSPSDQ